MVNLASNASKNAPFSAGEIEERFRLAQELSLDGFAILRCFRPKGEIIDFVWDYLNPAAGKLLRRKDLPGRNLGETWPAKDKKGLLTALKRVMASGTPFEGEVAYQTDKLSGWFQLTAVKLGESLALSWREITERKLWEESLKQSETRFRVITQSNMVGLFFWDEQGTILDANEAFLKILGFNREKFFQQKRTWKDLTPPQYWPADEEAMTQMKKTGACTPFEKELRHRDGHLVPILLGAARLEAINYEGVAFVVDISERKEAEKEREIFLGHELKTPLSAIKGFAQLLLKRLQKTADSETLSYLSRISRKVDGLTGLINDLTDFTRLRSGQLEFRPEFFDFDALVKEVITDCQATSASHRFVLEGETRAKVLADKTRIGQVLLNLFSNAVKYSPQAEKVIVRLGRKQRLLIVSVQDFGFGIPAADQEKIFTPFFRSALSKNEVNGVGLGLYICRQIAGHYHGQLSIQSQEGQGTTFTFSLPFKETF
jgi:PAS domain S-box-containing protein